MSDSLCPTNSFLVGITPYRRKDSLSFDHLSKLSTYLFYMRSSILRKIKSVFEEVLYTYREKIITYSLFFDKGNLLGDSVYNHKNDAIILGSLNEISCSVISKRKLFYVVTRNQFVS